MTSTLQFDELQDANRERGKIWGKGQEIPYLFNAVELGGETGELVEALEIGLHAAASAGKTLNAVKKYYRGEIGIAGGVEVEKSLDGIRDELGDVVICCSLLANKLGIDLGAATKAKFNKTSDKYGLPTKL